MMGHQAKFLNMICYKWYVCGLVAIYFNMGVNGEIPFSARYFEQKLWLKKLHTIDFDKFFFTQTMKYMLYNEHIKW